jgi:hypothetical protein
MAMAKIKYFLCILLTFSILCSIFTKPLTTFAVGNPVSYEVFSGNETEWSGITHDTVTRTSTLSFMKAIQQNGKINIYVKGAELLAGGVFYIESDNKETTGTSLPNWSDSKGIDYKIENNNLYKFINGSWEAISGSSLQISKSDSELEVSLEYGDMALVDSKPMKVAFYLDGVSCLPEASHNMMLVNEEETTIYGPSANVTVDGNADDWSGVTPVSVSADGKTSLYACITDGKLYMMAKGKLSDAEYSGLWEFFYLDVDKNPATGNNLWQYASDPGKSGADYTVQLGALYQGDGAGGWAQITVENFGDGANYFRSGSGENKIIEWMLPISALGMPTAKSIRVAYFGDSTVNMTPSFVTVYPSDVVNVPPIIIEGNTSDWGGINNVVNASGTTYELYTVQDGKRLYTLVKGADLNTRNVYYIDSDNYNQTGYSINGLWENSGIDYIVDSSKLYKLTGNNPDIDRQLVGDVFTYYTKTSAEMYLDLSMIGKRNSGTVGIGYIGKGSIDIPAVSSSLKTIHETIKREELGDTFYPNEYYGILNNPYIGWVPWGKDSKMEYGEAYKQPHKLVYAGITWRDLEPDKGSFDWKSFESKYQFDFWAGQGKKINIRIILDYPSSEAHWDIPDWLYDEIGGKGTAYNDSNVGKGFSPDYTNETLIAEHKRMIEALAARYKDDPRIAYVQLGSLGHWGEWHCWPYSPSTGVFPVKSVSDQYVQHYIDAFSQKKILTMRRAYGMAKDNKFGLFNDVFGDVAAFQSEGWGWIWGIKNGYTDDMGQVQPAMLDFWKYAPSGGEFSSGNALLWLTDSKIMDTLNMAREGHTSWLGPCSPANYQVNGPLQANIDALQKTLGYRFVLESAAHEDKADAGSTLPVTMKWNNKGVAPFYFNWPLQLSLANSSGTIVASTNTDEDIRTWLPGRKTITKNLDIPLNLASGKYTLCVSIIDPQTNEPAIDLAIEGRRSDGRYELGTIKVKKA